jgi:hypothetical protein
MGCGCSDVSSLDRQAKLILITNGFDMNHSGCLRTWEFIFFIPKGNVTVMLILEPDPQTADVDSSPCILTQRIKKASSIDANRPAFQNQFRDSPDVVAEFSAHGVDFVAGPSDMKLEGHILPSGEAVWVTYYWGRENSASFKKTGS